MKRYGIYLLGLTLVVYADVYGQSIFENFDSREVGDYMGVVSPDWTTWGGFVGGIQDVQVTDDKAASGDNSIYFHTETMWGGPQNVIIPFGGAHNTGTLVFESKFWVEDNKGAYFNFQGTETSGEVLTMNCQMVNDGRLLLDVGADPLIETTYPSETWFTLTINVNLNTNSWELLLDGVSQGSFASINDSVASVNILPVNDAAGGNHQAGYYMDDVFYEYISYDLPSLNAGVTLMENLAEVASTTMSPNITVRNLGTTTITSFDLTAEYNGEIIEENITGVSIPSLGTYEVDFDGVLNVIAGEVPIAATVSNVNGGDADDDPSDDTKIILLDPLIPAEGKMVLVEEATATWCSWCPRGEVYMAYMAEKYPDHFIGVAVHGGDPMAVPAYSWGLGAVVSGYPSITVDRVSDIDPVEVEEDFLDRVLIAPKAVLTVGSDYIEGATSMNVSITADFKETISGDYRLALVIVEDSVTGTGSDYDQANSYSGGLFGEMGGYEDLPNPIPAADMVYNHVARSILPDFDGVPESFPMDVAEGEIYAIGFEVEIDTEWDLDKIHLVGLLIAPDGTVDNAGWATMSEAADNDFVVKLEESLIVSDAISLYPNPTINHANIDLGIVENETVIVEVYDLDGKLLTQRNYGTLNGDFIIPLELANFESGIYNVRVFKGSQMELTRLVIK